MTRKDFIKNSAVISFASAFPPVLFNMKDNQLKSIKISGVGSDFEREPLTRPFGFKGGYLTELWQTMAMMRSENGIQATGLATQSVLYGDPEIFLQNAEPAGNALMYTLTDKALQMVKNTSFTNPIQLLETILPSVTDVSRQLAGMKKVNPNFIYNALVSLDHAAWMVYARENQLKSFDEMIPPPYKEALNYRNKKIAVMYQVPYGMPPRDIVQAAKNGYFIFKIKTGSPGTQEAMVEADMERLSLIHKTLKDLRTPQTADGKLVYTLDANGRYEKKETLLKYLTHARKIGAYHQIKLVEEPLSESNQEDVKDIEIIIGADESVHTEEDATRRMQQGYRSMVLKGIAKTLSMSLKIAKLAHDNQLACMCADLTVNPILLDWHKNLAAHLKPFPGIGMPMIETNGDMNYTNWSTLQSYHPVQNASWQKVQNGVFELNDDFYKQSGGIFQDSAHYNDRFKTKDQ